MIWPIVFFSIVGIAGLVAIKKPGVAFALLISMFGIEQFFQTQSGFFISNRRAVNLSIGFVIAIATIFSASRNRKVLNQPGAVQILTIVLFGYAFLSSIWTPGTEAFEARWYSSIPYLAVFLFAGPVLTQEKGAVKDGLRWTLFIGVPLLFLTAYYCEWGSRGLKLAIPTREGNRLIYESLPLAIASFASYVGVTALVVHTRMPFAMFFRLAVLGTSVYIAFLTQSRGQAIASIAVAATIYPVANQIKNAKGILISVIGLSIFGGIIYLIVSQIKTGRWQADRVESAVLGRQAMWTTMLNSWFFCGDMRIFTGLGAAASFHYVGFYPHNLPVEILTELGIVGFCIFATIIWISVVNSFLVLKRLNKYPEIRGEVLVLLGLMFLSLLLCLKEGSLYTWPVMFFFAICLSQKEKETRSNLDTQKRWADFYRRQQMAAGAMSEQPMPSSDHFPNRR